jgi:RNA polymerase sigma-70 factor (ECF subfamily)
LTILPAATARVASTPATAPTEIDRLKRRDSAAWSALFEREHQFVFRFVLAQVRDQAVAEDITGQVFLEAIEGIGRYRDRGLPLRAWLLAIGRHRALDWFRRRAHETGAAIEPVVPGPEEGVAEALATLATLTPDQREVVHLRFVEGYSLEEVAGLTHRSVGAVKAMQHRGLVRLRAELEPTEED